MNNEIDHSAFMIGSFVHNLDLQLNEQGRGYAIKLGRSLARGETVAAGTSAELRLRQAEDTLRRLVGQVEILRTGLVRPAELPVRHLVAAE